MAPVTMTVATAVTMIQRLAQSHCAVRMTATLVKTATGTTKSMATPVRNIRPAVIASTTTTSGT